MIYSVKKKAPVTKTTTETGDHLRKDDGKIRFDLIPWEWTNALARLLTKGAAKYAPRGWEAGMDHSRCLGALKRHLNKYEAGEQYDTGPGGSGAHHLVAVAWNALVLFSYQLRGVGKDDRPVYKLKQPLEMEVQQ